MKEKNRKFKALTPELLKKNKSIYNEALDYAFNNEEIKNIAITGIYGAGKSSVWKTYVNERKLNNIITVSLGKYKDDIDYDNSNLIDKVKNNAGSDESGKGMEIDRNKEDEKGKANLENENRIECQIINQILSQIEKNKIPLSKYGFKSNKNWLNIFFQTLTTISVIFSILLWVMKNDIIFLIDKTYKGFNGLFLILITVLLFIIPIFYFLFIFFRENKPRISKITFKGAEANINDLDKDDESVLDRNIKELVYLISSSNSKIIVFEDLDRYDNISIFTKLRELNFLLNKNLRINGEKDIVRFVYMVRDGLFISKNRVKFFDFIIPIVPVIDSRNSENKLLEAFDVVTNKPDQKIISKIALYVDDMRLLKNIINEYIVYENIIEIKDLKLDANKLFSLIVLKNVFPNEFDLLQLDKGNIINIFRDIENHKVDIISSLENKLEKLNNRLIFINNYNANSKFEIMAQTIPVNISIANSNKVSWAEFLKKYSLNKSENFIVYDSISGNTITKNYTSFVDDYIYKTEEIKKIINSFPEDKSGEINKLKEKELIIKNRIRKINSYNIKECILEMKADDINKIFNKPEYKITQSYYFRLIRFLIVEGLVDETYWLYKGCFYEGCLGKNDTIFIKNLGEAKNQDIFLNIENPFVVLDRLEDKDYNKFNILNKNLFEACIEVDKREQILAMMDSVELNNNYNSLIQIMDSLKFATINKFINIVIQRKAEEIISLLNICTIDSSETFKNILISIYTIENIEVDILKLFKTYIEQNEVILSFIDDKDFDIFINNITLADVKFENLSESCFVDYKKIKQIEKQKLYKLNIGNIIFICRALLDNNFIYGNLASKIYTEKKLLSTKEYIENHFVEFFELYIDGNIDNISYENDENIVIEIINSKLSIEYKQKYIENNETPISNISYINNLKENMDLIEYLFEKDKILFNQNNISNYWSSVDEASQVFLNYFDKNINDNNYIQILGSNKDICNSFINNPSVSEKIFKYSIEFADAEIDFLNKNINKDRVLELINKKLVLISHENLEILLNNFYYNELVKLIDVQHEEEQDQAVMKLLEFEIKPELLYELLNSNISDANAKKIIDETNENILIEKISFNKLATIGYIIDKGLSNDNINFICKNFEDFNLKDKYIKYLDEYEKISKINNENLSKSFINQVISGEDISVNSKIDLILIKINNKASKEELIDLISKVEVIAELATVWRNKRPALDNSFKEIVGEALICNKYVKKRKDRDYVRIWIK